MYSRCKYLIFQHYVNFLHQQINRRDIECGWQYKKDTEKILVTMDYAQIFVKIQRRRGIIDSLNT